MELWESFEERLRASTLLKLAVEAFHGQTDWLDMEEDDLTQSSENRSEQSKPGEKKGRVAYSNTAPPLLSPGSSLEEEARVARLEKILNDRKDKGSKKQILRTKSSGQNIRCIIFLEALHPGA